MRFWCFLAALGPALMLGACDFAPAYAPPKMAMPAKFKGAGAGIWQAAHPDDNVPHGDWWRSYKDHTLDSLETQVELNNQDLAAALASYQQARAYVARAQSGLLPSVQHEESFAANRASIGRGALSEPNYYGNNFLDVSASYEVDVWGEVRDRVARSQAQAQASGAIFESVRLSLQAELARDYVSLRGLDQQANLLRRTVVAYRAALDLTRQRLTGKIAAPIDVDRAEVQLDSAEAQLADIAGPRALLVDAIATLVGKPASNFSLPFRSWNLPIPSFPAGVPSTLLERRPDIAVAERETAAANETIGIAKAAFFPRFTINLVGGTQDTGLNLLSLPYSFWSVGPSVYLPLFDGGLRLANLSVAQAAYKQHVAYYRGTVLKAIQEVEDNLAVLRALRIESRSTRAAAVAAQKAEDLALTLYRDGAVNYLEVVVAQTAALTAEQVALSVETRRLQTSVALILALGGDFSVDVAQNLDPHQYVDPQK
ncbi:MAG: efflux transporter outer membrane subunit [Methylovirgula sp.]